MQTYHLALELLDRRYALVADAADDVALLHVMDFLRLIKFDTLIQLYTVALLNTAAQQATQNQDLTQPIVEELKSQKDALLAFIPALDDQQLPRPDLPGIQYFLSFRRFNDILAGDDLMARGQALEPGDPYEDQTPVGRLLKILSSKLQMALKNYPANNPPPALESLQLRFLKAREERSHFWREFINRHRVSAEAALGELLRLEQLINLPPPQGDTLRDWLQRSVLRDDGGLAGAALRKEIYEQQSNPERVRLAKWVVRRVYEGLRARIGSTLSHQLLVGRYKARAMWYDKERLRQLVTNAQGNFIRRREDTLVLEMAKWLFDNGLPIFVKTKFANLEPDLLSIGSRSILIEGKAYKAADKSIAKNIAQLHAYLNSLDASQFHIEEAYYVVFRLDGPLYDLPRTFVFNRHIIYPVVIDLGLAEDSGRKQSAPVVITQDDILTVVNRSASIKTSKKQ
jgi:hypothetical protein